MPLFACCGGFPSVEVFGVARSFSGGFGNRWYNSR
ncbi:hypothetical protein A2U01_0108658, partial [Trifolium medium]|nr:hypothetical protein [Trifolium medium]